MSFGASRGIERLMFFLLKRSSWLLLTGAMLGGCVNGSLPDKAAWPWESTKDYDKVQTGNFIGIRGNVANFGEPPKAVQPVNPESLLPQTPAMNAAREYSLTQPPVPSTKNETSPDSSIPPAIRDYDFSLSTLKIAPPAYLPAESVRTEFDIMAFNHGNAPVSVSIGIDPASSQNIAADKPLPSHFVVKPHTDQALVHIGPKVKSEGFNFRTSYSWNIGDFTATHTCPEHYRYPFNTNITARASISDAANSAAFTRYAVIFVMPVGTPILAARKGVVVQIKPDRVDILHEDATIATYGHLGAIAEGIVAGKAVATEDTIGVVGTTDDQKEGFLQLTVWRPEPLATASSKTVSHSEGFDFISFPLEFCNADASQCGVLTQGQIVSRNPLPAAKKQGTGTSKTKSTKRAQRGA